MDGTRERICQAAIRTVSQDGLLAMTLDNVAQEAGVSKGGVMYHFPTKEALVTATLTYYGELAERMLMTQMAHDPNPKRRWARAMLNCLFPAPDSPPADGDSAPHELSPELLHKFMLAVVAAAVNNPGIFAPLKQIGTRLQERLLSDPDDGLDQLLIWLALDGLFLWQFVGLIEPTDPLFQRIGEALRAQTDSKTSSAPLRAPPRRAVSSGMKADRREP